MDWLRTTYPDEYDEHGACIRVGDEFPAECGACHSQTCAEAPYVYVAPDPANLVWLDEFDTDGLPDANKKWGYDVGIGPGNDRWGNQELQYYTNADMDNAYVLAGTLKVRAVREDYEGMEYTSARLVTRNHGD